MRNTRVRCAVAMIPLLVGVGACGSADDSDATTTIVATTGIWADVVSHVVCDDTVRIDTIIPAGGDPHAFEPSLADRGTMDDAALIVANGLLLEEGLEDTLEAAETDGAAVFRMGDHVNPLSDDDHDDREHGDDHEHGGGDPHIWFDPLRVAAALPDLAERLVDQVGLDAAATEACVTDYQQQLADVDAEIKTMVASVPKENRTLVTNHDSLGYFADRYGFTVIGTVIPAPSGLAETNPAQLEALAELIEQIEVPAIFAETQHSTGDVDALADRIGDVDVVTLFAGTLGAPGSGADTYIGFLRTNARLITDALR